MLMQLPPREREPWLEELWPMMQTSMGQSTFHKPERLRADILSYVTDHRSHKYGYLDRPLYHDRLVTELMLGWTSGCQPRLVISSLSRGHWHLMYPRLHLIVQELCSYKTCIFASTYPSFYVRWTGSPRTTSGNLENLLAKFEGYRLQELWRVSKVMCHLTLEHQIGNVVVQHTLKDI